VLVVPHISLKLRLDTPENVLYRPRMTHTDTLCNPRSIDGTLDTIPVLLQALQGALDGSPEVFWLNRAAHHGLSLIPPPGTVVNLVTMLYTRERVCPVVHILDVGREVLTSQVTPPEWSRQQCKRLDRELERFTREMFRGTAGKVLRHFELPPFPQLVVELKELVYGTSNTTH
jgi:hypothetical protein